MSEAELVEARVDWLTCTAGTGEKADALAELGMAVAREREREGAKRRSGAWQGYSGVWSGGDFVGRRADGAVLRLGGDSAAAWWRSGVQLSDHVSRVDLAVTARPDDQAGDLASDAYAGLLERPRGRGRPRLAKLIVDNQRGRTLYLGRRSSDAYLRLYDKAIESKQLEYRGCWRYELEAKGSLAPQYAKLLSEATDASATLVPLVEQAFRTRGVVPVFNGGASPGDIRPLRAPTDDDRRLAWLAEQVKPAVERLIRDGRRTAVLAALGLEE